MIEAENESSGTNVYDAPPVVHEVLAAPGRPMDTQTRAFFEPRFARRFDRVRIHTGVQAARSARAVGAEAYTVGRDIVFGAGRYAPHSSNGRALLAHELTHTVQQGDAPQAGGRGVLQRSQDDTANTLLARVEALAGAASADAFSQGAALTAAFADIHAMTPEDQALVISAVAQRFPVEVARNFALWVARGYENRYEQAMTLDRGPHGNLLPGFMLNAIPAVLMPAQARAHAFVEGVFEGAHLDRATQMQILGKLRQGAMLNTVFSGAFLAGALHGAALSIANMVSALFNLPEILAKLDEMIQVLLSSQGEAMAHALGQLVGEHWAEDLSSLLDKNAVQVSYWMGKKAGPLLAAVLLALVTGGVLGMARISWTVLREGFEALVDFSKLRAAQALSGVRVLKTPPTRGMVRIHKDGRVEWWVPAETTSEIVPTAVRAGSGLHPESRLLPGAGPGVPEGAPLPAFPGYPMQAWLGQMAAHNATRHQEGVAAALSRAYPVVPTEVSPLLNNILTNLGNAFGDNAHVVRVLELAPVVWRALQDPNAYALEVAEIMRRVWVPPESAGAAGYLAAVRALARERGVPLMELRAHPTRDDVVIATTSEGRVIELAADSGLIDEQPFIEHVVGFEGWIIDTAALSLTEQGNHGALTHLIQDMVVDRALRPLGSSALEFRRLLVRINSLSNPPLNVNNPGLDIWGATYDNINALELSQPENVWRPTRSVLHLDPGEL